MAYRTLTRQTLHYFSRPNQGPTLTPVESAAAWVRDDFHDDRSWTEQLTKAETEEVEAAVSHALAKNKPLQALRVQDFPLPTLRPRIERWRRELMNGRGFLLLRGIPVMQWPVAHAELFFWCFGKHLGIPGAQNPAGHLLGHVRDERDTQVGRAYRTNSNINFHCDAADVVGLLCLRKARSGGASRIVSSVSVFNALLGKRPDLIPRLFQPYMLDTHGEGGISYFPIEPCQYFDGELRTFYHTDYFRSVVEHAGLPALSPLDHEVLAEYDAIANSEAYYLDMDLEPGDVQLVNNHFLLHARTDYEDHPEPDARRHLLRLWLSLPQQGSLRKRLASLRTYLSLVTRLARVRAAAHS